MASDAAEIPDFKEEGVHTIAAQVTRDAVERIVKIIRRERERGQTKKALAGALAKNLADYDEHTRAHLLKLGFDEEIADDFPDSVVANSEQLKANTLVLTLQQPPAGLTLFSLVRHKGQDWLITEFKGNLCTLKQIN
jgi:hypothetical protein